MKFRFYITDLMEGEIVGTDDEAVAKNFANSVDCFVVDAEEGRWLQFSDFNAEVEAVDLTDYSAGDES